MLDNILMNNRELTVTLGELFRLRKMLGAGHEVESSRRGYKNYYCHPDRHIFAGLEQAGIVQYTGPLDHQSQFKATYAGAELVGLSDDAIERLGLKEKI